MKYLLFLLFMMTGFHASAQQFRPGQEVIHEDSRMLFRVVSIQYKEWRGTYRYTAVNDRFNLKIRNTRGDEFLEFDAAKAKAQAKSLRKKENKHKK
ncbi:hypothetical protein [Persicobacter diffluens]|uniref:Uncharacterized protein n=1 Tax=Persicobacter diffluens TaxID=981 RepID=A0AAN4W597_9BACT|nr:hypothetical protein PEDI_56560 [Persicobacter diffluens]